MKLVQKFLVLTVLGLFFGCISVMEPPIQPEQPGITPICRTVMTQEPYTTEECQNVSKMEEVCETRQLNYSLSDVNKTDLCMEKNLCVNWFPDGTCVNYYCSKGMTRCIATLKNLDPRKTGTWSVGANFAMDGATFKKNPISRSIFPLESAVFDFDQIYTMDMQQNRPECDIFVAEPAKLQDCSFITKIFEECKNITKYKEVQKQICE